MELDPFGRRAGHRQREERVVLVLHRDDAVVVLGLAARAACGTRRRSSCGTVVNTRIFHPPPLRCHCERSEAISFRLCAIGSGLLRRFAPRNDRRARSGHNSTDDGNSRSWSPIAWMAIAATAYDPDMHTRGQHVRNIRRSIAGALAAIVGLAALILSAGVWAQDDYDYSPEHAAAAFDHLPQLRCRTGLNCPISGQALTL
jgi:hypothetical protein